MMPAVAASGPTDLERFLEVIWRPGDVREVRIPGSRGTDSGYFDDPAALAAAVSRYDGRENIYVTLNPVEPALLARAANRIRPRARSTTADAQVVERRWLPVDIDPVRPSGISASETEREAALAVARSVFAGLRERGWPDPVTASSGNGYWLLYPIELPNDAPAATLVAGVLDEVAARFGTPAVSIDTSVHNASRIVALIGTLKVKGDATSDRPHRRSELLLVPRELVAVSREQLEALLPPAAGPSEPVIVVGAGRMPAGWVGAALDAAGIGYRVSSRTENTWYRLERCPFHPDDDQGGDCGVGEQPDGTAMGHCFHNRGAEMHWPDFKAALGLVTGSRRSETGQPGLAGATGGEETGTRIRVVHDDEHYDQLATAAFPEPPGPAAFGGLAGEVAACIAASSDVSEVGLLAAILAVAGGILAIRGIYHTEQPSALMTGLVGVTSEARKSTTIDLAWTTLAPALAAGYALRFDGLNSGEALVARLMALQTGGSARGILIEDEFSRLLVSSRREGSTLDAMLRTAFDARALSVFTRTSKADLTVVPPYVLAALSAITPRELRKLITPTMLVNGSVNRWLWVPVIRRQVESAGDELVALPDRLVRALTEAADAARRHVRSLPTERPAAATLNDYGRFLGGIEGLAGDMGRRLNVIAFRAALIHAGLDRSPAVSSDHVERAVALTEYARAGLGWVFGQLTGSREADLVARAVAAAGDDGLSLTEVTRKLLRNPVTRQEAIDTVVDLGLVRVERVAPGDGRGRPSQRLVWVGTPEWAAGTSFHSFHSVPRTPQRMSGHDANHGTNGNNPPFEINTPVRERGNNLERSGLLSTPAGAEPGDPVSARPGGNPTLVRGDDRHIACVDFRAHPNAHLYSALVGRQSCAICHPEDYA